MSLKRRLQRQLASARELSERVLADFKEPAQWTKQLHPRANHALWFAGHMGHTDNFLILLIAPEKAVEKPGFMELFGMGSRPTDSPDDYPAVSEVLDYMRERRGTLLGILDGLQEEDLARPTPKGAPEFMPDWASVFEMAIWHEGLHCGQLTVTRRSLGHGPLLGQQDEASQP